MFLSSSNADQSNSDWHGLDCLGGTAAGSVLPFGLVPEDSHGIQRLPHPSLALSTESPSLSASNGAREMKFVVADDVAQTIMAWARQHLAADPHVDESEDGYHVNSLYLDTLGFDTYRRLPGFRRRKFRLRRYGQEAMIWLEVKRKRSGNVRKRRVSVAETNLIERLTQPADSEWEGAWFRRRLDTRQLRPVCQVMYRRFARVGMSVTGPIRLTIDSDLFATDADDWQIPLASPFGAPQRGVPLLNGRRIVELKFRDVLPAAFRGLIQDLRLAPSSFSKYRESVAACIPLSRLTGECV